MGRGTELGTKKRLPLLSVLFVLVMTAVCAVMVWRGLTKLIYFENVTERAITVSGVITDVKKDTDSEGDLYYELYVTYSVDGKSYKANYDRLYNDSALNMVGEVVSFRVDPVSPGALVDNMKETGQVFYLFGSFAVIFFFTPMLVALFRRFDGLEKNTYAESLGMTTENIQKDLLRSSSNSMLCFVFLTWSLVATISCVMLPHALNGVLKWMTIPWAIGIVFLMMFLSERRRILNGEFTIRSGRVTGRDYDSDPDGPDTYYLFCSDGTETWKWIVSHADYKSIPDGIIVRTVFFGRKEKPRLTYRQDAF